jgi:transcriptional regulator with XRE-family HTH domain
MSIADFNISSLGAGGDAPVRIERKSRPLHRLAEVRRTQGVSRRTLARRLNTDVSEVKRQEEQTADLPLSELYRWQKALDVPLVELLVESNESLSAPVLKRAQMVRLMKTAVAILERSRQAGIKRMAQVLVNQLIELMPELKEVNPWHAVGKRRTQREVGQAAERRLCGNVLRLIRDMGD